MIMDATDKIVGRFNPEIKIGKLFPTIVGLEDTIKPYHQQGKAQLPEESSFVGIFGLKELAEMTKKKAENPPEGKVAATRKEEGTLADKKLKAPQVFPKLTTKLNDLWKNMGGDTKTEFKFSVPVQDDLKNASGDTKVPSVVPKGGGVKIPKDDPVTSVSTASPTPLDAVTNLIKDTIAPALTNIFKPIPTTTGETATVNVPTPDVGTSIGGVGGPIEGSVKGAQDEKPAPSSGDVGGGSGNQGGSISTPTNINAPENSLATVNSPEGLDCYFVSSNGTKAKEMRPSDIVSTDCDIDSLAPPGDTSAGITIEDDYGNDLGEFDIPIYVESAISPMTVGMIAFGILALLTVSGFFGRAYSKKKKLKRLEKEITQQAVKASDFMNM